MSQAVAVATNLSDDGGEDEDSEHEVDDDKGVLGVGEYRNLTQSINQPVNQ